MMEAPPILADAEAAPMVGKDRAKRAVKSSAPKASVPHTPQEDVLGDTEQMRQIKAYIQE